MPLETLVYAPTRQEYFKLLARNYFYNSRWLYYILILLCLWTLGTLINSRVPPTLPQLALFIFVVLMPLYYLHVFWRFTGEKRNQVMYLPRRAVIVEDTLLLKMENGREDELRLADLQKVSQTARGIVLFKTKYKMLFIPRRAFAGNEEMEQFTACLRERGGR